MLETLNRELFKRVLIKILLRLKAEFSSEDALKLVNSVDEHDASILHYVSALNYYELIPILVENGADVNLKSKNGLTPLMISAAKGHEKAVKKLMRLGAVFH